MCTSYYEIYRMKGERSRLRQRVVADARRMGIKATAREHGCSRNTVRKWLRRDVPGCSPALKGLSRAPKSCPHKTPADVEAEVVRLRRMTGYGAERLKREFNPPL